MNKTKGKHYCKYCRELVEPWNRGKIIYKKVCKKCYKGNLIYTNFKISNTMKRLKKNE